MVIGGFYRTVTGISFCRAVKRTVSASAPLPLTSATVEPDAPTFQDKRVFQWRPKAATNLCRFAAKARFDNRQPQGGGFQRGRAAALPLWSFQGWGIFKGEGKSKSLPPCMAFLVTFVATDKSDPPEAKRKGKKKRQKGNGRNRDTFRPLLPKTTPSSASAAVLALSSETAYPPI